MSLALLEYGLLRPGVLLLRREAEARGVASIHLDPRRRPVPAAHT